MSNLFTFSSNCVKDMHYEDEYQNLYLKLYRIHQTSNLDKDASIASSKRKVHDDYSDWLSKRLALLKRYAEYLGFQGINPNRFKESSIELFSGQYDSLARVYPSCLTVYSKYGSTFSEEIKAESKIELFDITIIDGVPNYVLKTPEGTRITVPFNISENDRYYVSNPNNAREKKMCEELLRNPDITTIYGVYGLASEIDLEDKISEMEEIADKDSHFKFFRDTGNTNKIGKYKIGLIYKPRQNKNRH